MRFIVVSALLASILAVPAAAAACKNTLIPVGSPYTGVLSDPTCAGSTDLACITDSCRMCVKSCRALGSPAGCVSCNMLKHTTKTFPASSILGCWYLVAASPAMGPALGAGGTAKTATFSGASAHNVTLSIAGGPSMSLYDPAAAAGGASCMPAGTQLPDTLGVIGGLPMVRVSFWGGDMTILTSVATNDVAVFAKDMAAATPDAIKTGVQKTTTAKKNKLVYFDTSGATFSSLCPAAAGVC